MANYAIGDIQGCYDQLRELLELVAFKPTHDQLWLVGDLVNRGPRSLEVLRYLANLPIAPIITLGNHDLHLLAIFHQVATLNPKDTFHDVLAAPDAASLCAWLQAQHLLYYNQSLNILMAHAGVAPQWNITDAIQYAQEIETVLHGNDAKLFLQHMYGNYPNIWSNDLSGMDRWRLIVNYLTRMRYCTAQGALELHYKGTITQAPQDLVPWFLLPGECWQQHRIIFGHWAALAGKTDNPNIIALDTGCVWGGHLTALRLEDNKLFKVSGWRASI